MKFKYLTKKRAIALLVLFFASSYASSEGQSNGSWYDMSNPREIYSGVSVAAGSEGVNLAASYGSYLSGQFKQKLTLRAMNNLDYYAADYILLNVNTNTGFSFESTWNRDLWGIEGFNDSSAGVFAKIPLSNAQIKFYPKLNLGMIWGDHVTSTTYIKFEATTRLNLSPISWVGVTPSYTYAMEGLILNKIQVTLDAGVQLSAEFTFAAHLNNHEEFWFDVIFAF